MPPPVAPLPEDERLRLAQVRRLRLSGTPAEERFDKITKLAKRMFGVDVSIIDLVGETRVWLKSVQGWPANEHARDVAYCAWTILEDEIVYIPDSTLDARIHDNPFVGDVRFYAGKALKSNDQRVGVFCIADSKPRTMSPDDLEALEALAELAEREINVVKLSEAQMALADANDKLLDRALVDPLTRCWNRGAIMEIVEAEIKSSVATSVPLSIIMLDIDHFKNVNDTYGHEGGDTDLREVANRLRATVRPYDAVGRFGGEEFLVVLPGADLAVAAQVAERLRLAICGSPIDDDDKRPISVSSSFGVAETLVHPVTDRLVRRADEALYASKRAGRNRVSLAPRIRGEHG